LASSTVGSSATTGTPAARQYSRMASRYPGWRSQRLMQTAAGTPKWRTTPRSRPTTTGAATGKTGTRDTGWPGRNPGRSPIPFRDRAASPDRAPFWVPTTRTWSPPSRTVSRNTPATAPTDLAFPKGPRASGGTARGRAGTAPAPPGRSRTPDRRLPPLPPLPLTPTRGRSSRRATEAPARKSCRPPP